MKILITGSNGYIGKSLCESLREYYEITCIGRDEVNLLKMDDLRNYFDDKNFDVVIHCAVTGGKRTDVDSEKVMEQNLIMYYNLLSFKHKYKKFIHFGSGAENSDSFYGLSKKVINQSLKNYNNFYNIRIFAVFDENELDSRFIKTTIINYLNNKQIVIFKNKNMDFFYMKDLITLVRHYIDHNENLPQEIDCSYRESHSLIEISKIINHLSTHRVDISVQSKDEGDNYTGTFTELNLNYVGLESGIKEVYKKINDKQLG
jgi:nucleoside-diphosphate-sugar epimerase